jgi:WD40 repeat protein
MTGCFDEKLRVYNLRERELVHLFDTKFMITSLCFGNDGNIVIIGTYDGKCIIYSFDSIDVYIYY